MKSVLKGTPVFVLFMTGTKLRNLHKCPTWQFPTQNDSTRTKEMAVPWVIYFTQGWQLCE